MTGVDSPLIEVIAERVLDYVSHRAPGHCLQVAHLPRPIADQACRIVYERLEHPDAAMLVVSDHEATGDGLSPWHAKSTKVVELRNSVEKDRGRLVLFIPAGERVAAEDSFSNSTFELMDLQDLSKHAVSRLMSRLELADPGVAELAATVIATLHERDFAVDYQAIAGYLVEVLSDPTAARVGLALVEVGLLPDKLLADTPDEIGVRLARNLTQMRALTVPLPPVERIRLLPLDRDSQQGQEIQQALIGALEDGTLDRMELARRFSPSSIREKVDFDRWRLQSAIAEIEELTIVDLIGDFAPGSERAISKPNASIGVRFRSRPPLNTVEDLKEVTLELMKVGETLDELLDAGPAVSKRTKFPATAQGTMKCRVDTEDLLDGLYCFRLRAFDVNNLVLKEAVSEPFRRGEELEEPVHEIDPSTSIQAAYVRARMANPGGAEVEPQITIEEAERDDRQRNPITLAVHFPGTSAAWEMRVARLLAEVELQTLGDANSLGRYTARWGSDEVVLSDLEADIPESFLSRRHSLFEALRNRQLEVQTGGDTPVLVALADLGELGPEIADYVDSWTDSLLSAQDDAQRRALLSTDQLSVTDLPGASDVRLIGPTHPLRLMWLSRYSEAMQALAHSSEGQSPEMVLSTLHPVNVPHLVPGRVGALRHVEPIDLFWGIWAPPGQADRTALTSRIRSWLRLDRSTSSSIGVRDVVQRVKRYLIAHPYVDLLVLNFVQPGSGRLVLEALLELQNDSITMDLRYVVRLFESELSRSELGSALDDFMSNPEESRVYKKDAADALLSSTGDRLAPKLTYSKHQVADFLSDPERYPAHLTFFLDWFDLSVVPSAPLVGRRSFFGAGLIVEPVVNYRAGGDAQPPSNVGANPQWDEQVAADPNSQDAFERAFAISEQATALTLRASAPGQLPSVRLDLDNKRQSILDAVHRVSDWVVVIDPVFTDDYFDTPVKEGESARYLIDYVAPGTLETSRKIMVSTRSRAELQGLLRPVMDRYGLNVADERVEVVIDALQALGAGLPLRLLNNRTQAAEALTLALSSIYLRHLGVLHDSLVISLDLHQELFREAMDWSSDIGTDLRRTDLLILNVDVQARRFDAHLVEVKARAALPAGMPMQLVEQVAGQLENSRQVLAVRLFGADVVHRTGLAAGVQVRRLTRLVASYLERSRRYGAIDEDRVAPLRAFLVTLDQPYSVRFSKHAILFDLDGESQALQEHSGVAVHRVGRADIEGMLTQATTRPHRFESERPTGSIDDILRPTEAADLELVAGVDGAADRSQDVPRIETGASAESPHPNEAAPPEEGPLAQSVMMLGTPASRQFGIIGTLVGADSPVAVDFDGTNVISLFGVQGAGKSYTIGTLIEAALAREPALNRRPHPPGVVVFHYDRDQTYLPEYASMVRPNSDRDAVEVLRTRFGAEPASLPDVLALVPADLFDERRREMQGVEVRPLLIAPSELGIDDWQLFMGLSGGDQMYTKAMNMVFRELRSNITLPRLEDAVRSAAMSRQQQNLALQRIAFVKHFVSDAGGISNAVAPGRLLIVDLRDEYVQDDEALATFMVLLNRFTQTATGGQDFSKVIVFDEAHKYMDNARLRQTIIENVRLMRHRATTVIIASQNPPSVPREIIELSSVVIAHRFTSPLWLDHIAKAKTAFDRKNIAPSQMAGLSPGDAFVWSDSGAPQFQRPSRVRIRPRLTEHGGGTRMAGG